MDVVGGPPAGSGGGVGSELVVSIAILFNGWTQLASRLDSKIHFDHGLRGFTRMRINEPGFLRTVS